MVSYETSTGRGNGGTKIIPRFFYLNGDCHKKLHLSRGHDRLTAFNYDKGKLVVYSYTDVRNNMKRGYTTIEVCQLICRSRFRLLHLIGEGQIETPTKTYAINENKRFHQYIWDEEHIFKLHDFFLTVHRGQPRKDGKITPSHLPTRLELRAMLDQETILYVKGKSGEFVPTFQSGEY